MSLSTSWLPPIGEVLLGRYYVIELVGKGPIGAVYRVVDRALDRQLAIKVLHPDLFDIRNKDTNSFRVMRARAHLSEHVASIHEVYLDGKDLGAPFLVEELISGPNLRQLMQRRADSGGILTFSEIRLVMEGLCKALRAIHRLSIHGNLKPENVFLLGSAIRVTDPYYLIGRTRLNWFPGEFPLRDHYLASEQLMRGQEESIQSDIFALGMIFGEMIVGEAVRFGVPLSDQGPEVPAGADRLFLKATANESLNRYATIDSFLAELRRVLPDEASRVDVEDPDTQIVQLTDVLTSDEIARIAAINRARQAERAQNRQGDTISEAYVVEAPEAETVHDVFDLEEVEELAFVTPVEIAPKPTASLVADEDVLDRTMIDTPERLEQRLQQAVSDRESQRPQQATDLSETPLPDENVAGTGDDAVIELDSDDLSPNSESDLALDVAREHRGWGPQQPRDAETPTPTLAGLSGGFSLSNTLNSTATADNSLAETQVINRNNRHKTVLVSGTAGNLTPAPTVVVASGTDDDEGLTLIGDEEENDSDHGIIPVQSTTPPPAPPGETPKGKNPIDPRLRSFAAAQDLEEPTLMTTLGEIGEVELRPHPKKKKNKKKKTSGNTTIVVPPPLQAANSKPVNVRVAVPVEESSNRATAMVPVVPDTPKPRPESQTVAPLAPAVPKNHPKATPPTPKVTAAPTRQPVAAAKKHEKSSGVAWTIAALLIVGIAAIVWIVVSKQSDSDTAQHAAGIGTPATPTATPVTQPVAVPPAEEPDVTLPQLQQPAVEDTATPPADTAPVLPNDVTVDDTKLRFANSRRTLDETNDEPETGTDPQEKVVEDNTLAAVVPLSGPRRHRWAMEPTPIENRNPMDPQQPTPEDAKKSAEEQAKKAALDEAKKAADAQKAAEQQAKKDEAKRAEEEAKKALALAKKAELAEKKAAEEAKKNELAMAATKDAAAQKTALAEKKAAEAEAKKLALAEKKAIAEAKKAEAEAKKAEALAKKKAEAEAKKAARLAAKTAAEEGPPVAGCPGGMRKIERNVTRTVAGQNVIERTIYCIDAYEYPGKGSIPKTGISWHGAASACQAKGKRLCTSGEWKGACGGKYPYGGIYEPSFCNTMGENGEERPVVAAGSFAKCKSPYGLYDMSGNVSEWTADKTVNGGNSTQDGDSATCSRSPTRMESSSSGSVGFRCCADPE